MKSTTPTRSCHFWTYVLMALVPFQLAGFAYSQPFATQPLFRFCGDDLHRATAWTCQDNGYDLNKDRTQAYDCCWLGCSYLALSVFCGPQPPPVPNRPRYILCGSDFYTALDSLCVNGYDSTKAGNQASECCSPGCPLSELIPVCKTQRVGVI